MRVLHLPTTVGGMPWALAQGEKSIGLESRVLYRASDWLDYPYDVCLGLEKEASNLKRLKSLVSTFLSIRGAYDIFHFNYGQSLIHSEKFKLTHVDLPFYPKRAKLFVTYNGCDARQKFPTLKRTKVSACHDPLCYGGICNSGNKDRIRRKSIAKMARYVRHIWAVNPDLLHFLPREKSSFLPYAVIVDGNKRDNPKFSNKRLRIIHAPTNRGAKGSEIIIGTMRDLERTKSNRFEFRLVENVPHREAMRIFREADLLIDQLLVGWYGGIAVEFMSMGKPVICRIAKEDLKFIPKQMANDVKEAFIQAELGGFRDTILKCIEGERTFLKMKSEAALNYAHTWHEPGYVASITKEAYDR